VLRQAAVDAAVPDPRRQNSLFNTPPCFSIYILRNVLAYNKSIGGLEAIYKNNLRKASCSTAASTATRRFTAATSPCRPTARS